MAEGNTSDGQCKSRSALGDLTNLLGKRGFSSIGKVGVKSFSFNDKDKDSAKRLCVSPRPCTEINSLKGNIVSGISKIPNENRDQNLAHLGSGSAASKSSLDVRTDGEDVRCMGGNRVMKGKKKVHYGTKGIIDVMDLRRADDVSWNVNQLNDIDGDSCGEIDYSDDGAGRDGIAAKNCKDSSLADFEGGKAVNSIITEDNGYGNLDVSKEETMSGVTEFFQENKCLGHNGGGSLINIMKANDDEEEPGSSLLFNNKNNPEFYDPGRVNDLRFATLEINNELGDSSPTDTSRTVSETDVDYLHADKNCEVNDAKVAMRSIQSDINEYHNDMEAYNSDNLILSQSGSIDCPIFPESQESRVFGVGNDCAYVSEGTASARDCSCSFCKKAGYILLDLNYQDTKARLSALRKSQKEAIILAERNSKSKGIWKHGAQSFEKDSNLESQLMYQWRSLFQHMANIWEEEGNQLEASLSPLTDLREKCKADLESTNGMPSEKF